jgi:di/tricarboxylate transporter
MRGMTRFYHERFFSDVRVASIGAIALLVVGWGWVPEAFALVPVVALIGAAASAFDASYLIFARHYAARLERVLDPRSELLVAAALEDAYLFPLNRRKLVVAGFGSGFTWFGFMTLFFTATGAAAYGFGLALAIPVVKDHGEAWLSLYLGALGVLTIAALAVGWWWFVMGAGERRLRAVLDVTFPGP